MFKIKEDRRVNFISNMTYIVSELDLCKRVELDWLFYIPEKECESNTTFCNCIITSFDKGCRRGSSDVLFDYL